REVEAFVDFLVFVLALLDVPTRQSVLDFSVRTGVLLEDDNQGAALRENSRDFGPRSRSPDDCNYVPRVCQSPGFRHKGVLISVSTFGVQSAPKSSLSCAGWRGMVF